MSLHERSSSPARGASPAPTIVYDSVQILKQFHFLRCVMRNMHLYTSRTNQEALDSSVRTFEWVEEDKPFDIVVWLLTLDLYNDRIVSFLDRVSDVCKKSRPEAFVLIVENKTRINSIQQEIWNCTAAEAAHIWLKDLRKDNISQTAVEKLQDLLGMQGAQARELLIKHIDSVIGIHKTQVGITWDGAQSIWAMGWIEDNVPDTPLQTQSKRHHYEDADEAPASPHLAASTKAFSDE
jgi:hypothetical protein